MIRIVMTRMKNSAMLYNKIPAWIRDEDPDTDYSTKYLIQIMASYFDTLHAQISALPYLKNKTYPSSSYKPLPFAKNLLEEKGFVTANLFADSDILELFEDRDYNQVQFEKKITDINQLSQEQVFHAMEQAKLERRQHFLSRHRLASGEIRDVEVYSGPIKVSGRQLLYSIVHDTTKRVKIEEALQQSRANLQMLFDSLDDFLFVLDMQGNVLRVNPVVLERLGYSEQELLGKTVLQVHPPDALGAGS